MPDRLIYISNSRGYFPDWKTKEFDPEIAVTVTDKDTISIEIRKIDVFIAVDVETAGELSLKLNEVLASL